MTPSSLPRFARPAAAQLPDTWCCAIVIIERMPLSLTASSIAALYRTRVHLTRRTRATHPHEEIPPASSPDVLGLPSISIDDSFFDLGGDSIPAHPAVQPRPQGGLLLTPRQVFQLRASPTLPVSPHRWTTRTGRSRCAIMAAVPLTPSSPSSRAIRAFRALSPVGLLQVLAACAPRHLKPPCTPCSSITPP